MGQTVSFVPHVRQRKKITIIDIKVFLLNFVANCHRKHLPTTLKLSCPFFAHSSGVQRTDTWPPYDFSSQKTSSTFDAQNSKDFGSVILSGLAWNFARIAIIKRLQKVHCLTILVMVSATQSSHNAAFADLFNCQSWLWARPTQQISRPSSKSCSFPRL